MATRYVVLHVYELTSNNRRNANAVSQNGELSVSSHRVLSLSTSQSPQHSTNAESISTPVVPIDNPDDDMWSAAYSEAVQSFNAKVENLAITGNKISDLLQGLKESSDNLNDSLFSRGLRRLKVPLENIKLVLDLTSPLAALDPTFATATATAAVKGVTAVRAPSYDIRVKRLLGLMMANQSTCLGGGGNMRSRGEITKSDR